MRGSGRSLGDQPLEADRPLGQRGGVRADDHDLVADRLHHARVVGQRVLDRVGEALDRVDRQLVAQLLGQARVAGEVGERDRHTQAPDVARALEVDLHVADDVLLDRPREEALVHRVHDRRGEREHLAGEALHLLGHLQARDAVAHERLVHVQVKEPHLRVGDLGNRLAVDAHELEQRDQREAGGEDRADVPQELQVVLGEVLERAGREARRGVDALDQRRLEADLVGGLVERRGSRRRRGTAPRCRRTPGARPRRPRGCRRASARGRAAARRSGRGRPSPASTSRRSRG